MLQLRLMGHALPRSGNSFDPSLGCSLLRQGDKVESRTMQAVSAQLVAVIQSGRQAEAALDRLDGSEMDWRGSKMAILH